MRTLTRGILWTTGGYSSRGGGTVVDEGDRKKSNAVCSACVCRCGDRTSARVRPVIVAQSSRSSVTCNQYDSTCVYWRVPDWSVPYFCVPCDLVGSTAGAPRSLGVSLCGWLEAFISVENPSKYYIYRASTTTTTAVYIFCCHAFTWMCAFF